MPQRTKEIFYKVLDMADVATLSEEEQLSYESALKGYMDTMSCIDNAKEEGLAKGRDEGREQGRAEGEAKGREQGRAEGEAKGREQGHAEGEAKGSAEGRVEGLAEGKSERNMEIARSMKADGLDIGTIAKYTGISVREINFL